ncbi:hypothetical protein BDBG_01783 [Blastomyces gilchristii SLH14081]|uniref:CFEM domain-containing protein n=1 Tax=Blastomyces gilchristii (strain SLH14081) TaxID=559298 RepID=A0A179UFT2_BLAGS|nr:uncharacterized protein BDBG_01783 [Blastomyces gilchristii SLH14081]OAT05372.1 hypothetical protein BDBG_01783 [Blastomyces gilchristii SLH14081]
MRLAITAAVASSLLALVAAQAGDLPKCAQECAGPAIPADCGIDPECICKAKSFIDAITCCVATKCDKDEQEKAISIAKITCAAVGVTDLPDAAVCDSASSSASAAPSSPSSKPTGSTAGPTASSEPTKSGAETTPTGSPTGSGTGAPPPAGTETPAAGNRVGVATGMGVGVGLVMGVLGVM